MSDTTTQKTHPAIIVAATTVALTCLLGIGVMTGLVPSPLTKGASSQQELTSAPAQTAPAVPAAGTRDNNRPVARAPAPEPRHQAARPPAERPPVGTTSSAGASNSVAGVSPAPAPAPAPACTNCGTITSVRPVKEQGQASIVGPAAGGVLGGVLGHQIGGGTGKTIATIAGAAVGAGVGTEVERRTKSTTHYVVGVRMNDGSTRSVTYDTDPAVSVGDKVRVADGRLFRD